MVDDILLKLVGYVLWDGVVLWELVMDDDDELIKVLNVCKLLMCDGMGKEKCKIMIL